MRCCWRNNLFFLSCLLFHGHEVIINKCMQSKFREDYTSLMSSRVERFRQKRITRKRTLAAILLFFILLFIGILTADYGVNNLIDDDRNAAIVAVNNNDDSVEIMLMNRRIILNKQYINRDLKYLRDKLNEIFQ